MLRLRVMVSGARLRVERGEWMVSVNLEASCLRGGSVRERDVF